jgi:branched-chain amino acid transport system ATP-binding protein
MILEARDLVVGYGDTTVIRGVDLSLAAGEVLGVMGRNGTGKTTLMRALAGTLPVRSGVIRFREQDVTALPAHLRARAGMQLVVQGRGIFPDLTVGENLKIAAIATGRRAVNQLDAVTTYFPRLGERMSQHGGTLSGGEQQMLAIGRALMANPEVILLDEPSEGIMPILVKQIGDVVRRIATEQGLGIIIVEQNTEIVFRISDRCLIIEKGRIVSEGLPAELRDDEIMRKHLAI